MIIRKLTPKDITAAYKLGLQQFEGEFWYTKRFLKETIKHRGLHYGAFENGKMLAVILFRIYDRPKSWVYFFVVDKKRRRTGLGSKLFSFVEKRLPKGYFLILVDLEKSDVEARKFYAKHGFKKQAKINHWFGNGRPGLIYAKKI